MLLIFLFVEDGSSEKKWYYETVCEGGIFEITCDHGRPPALQIINADWGRRQSSVCPYNADGVFGCYRDITKFDIFKRY